MATMASASATASATATQPPPAQSAVRYATVGTAAHEGEQDLDAFLSQHGGCMEKQNRVYGSTEFLIVRNRDAKSKTKLDKARKHGVRIVDEAHVRRALTHFKDWNRLRADAPEAAASAKRFAVPNGEAHLWGAAALAEGCATAETRAHAEALLCLAAMPATGDAPDAPNMYRRGGAPYVPQGVDCNGSANAFHDWSAAGVVRWFHHPSRARAWAAITAWERADTRGPKPSQDAYACLFESYHAEVDPEANVAALQMANTTQTGMLGELMRRYRRCGLHSPPVRHGPPEASTITWVIATALRLRRAAATALEALACHARCDAVGARWLCARHDAAEAQLARAVPLGHRGGCDAHYAEYEPLLGLVEAEKRDGGLAAIPLALAHMLAVGERRLPAEWFWLGDFVRFLCHGLVEDPRTDASHRRLAVLPHLAAAVDGAMGDDSGATGRCDFPVATAAAFGCANAQRRLQGTAAERGAEASAEWGACLPDDGTERGIVPQPTGADTRLATVPHGPVAVLALVVAHLRMLVRTSPSSPSSPSATPRPIVVSPLADAVARVGCMTMDDNGRRCLVTIDRRHAATNAGMADVSLDGFAERAWRDVGRLLRASDQWKDPTKAHSARWVVWMGRDVWEAVDRQVAQRRAELKHEELRTRLRTHNRVVLRLERFAEVSAVALHREATSAFLGAVGKRLGKAAEWTCHYEWSFPVVLEDLARRGRAAGSAAVPRTVVWMRLLVLALEGRRLCDRCAGVVSACRCEEEQAS